MSGRHDWQLELSPEERAAEKVWLVQQTATAEKLLADMQAAVGPFGDGGFGSHVDDLKSQLAHLESLAEEHLEL